ncbi:hypothetical protein BT96DRAFT_1021333 [Gymnopus androsaceus JB14]|uniref:Uncharacterized protein n=1 Tax=Gymnopus androsaceus JB14 TaxID=1447944 RepID=A0A6A4HGW4_9AGAR|nr:hypothetical protein BT96DRAFT_1021333 [Gymnopus androsaceus JB14]
MRLLSTLATNTVIYILLCCLSAVTIALDIDSQAGPQNGTHQELICIPFGVCEPCPSDELDKPFCQPFGNRRLIHCHNSTSSTPSGSSNAHEVPRLPPPGQHNNDYEHEYHPPPSSPHSPSSVGETPAWESCGRIVSQERADFYEFIACNVLFAIGAILVVYVRSRRQHALHARQLAARIGLIRR